MNLATFLPDLMAGVAVNFEIAGFALLIGLSVSAPLVWARWQGGVIGSIAVAVVAVLRAAPTFVVMFFLANVVPDEWHMFGLVVPFSGLSVVVASQALYATAYCADNGLEAMRHLRLGSTGAALLFLPNILRAFFVMMTSSSQGAAIGVVEGVTVTLRAADRLPDLSQRLGLYLLVVLVFVAIQQSAFAVINRLRSPHRTAQPGRRHRLA